MATQGTQQSRIARVYIQVIPALGQDFSKTLQRGINNALRSVDWRKLTKGVRAAARRAGAHFRAGFRSGVGSNLLPPGAFGNIKVLAERAGIKAARYFRTEFRKHANINWARTFRGADKAAATQAKKSAKTFARIFKTELRTTGFTIPQAANITAAANQAGRQYSQHMQNAIQAPTLPNASSPSGGGGGAGGGGGIGGAMTGILPAIATGALGASGVGGALNLDRDSKRIAASIGLSAEDKKVRKQIEMLYSSGIAYDKAVEIVESTLSSEPKLLKGPQKALDDTLWTATKFAVLFEEDLPKAMATSSQMVTQGFAKDMRQAMQLMGAAMQQLPKSTRAEIVDNLDEYSKHFMGLGLSPAQAIGLVAQAAKRGGAQEIDYFADSLKEANLRLSNISDPAASKALQDIGLDPQTVATNMLQGGPQAEKQLMDISKRLLSIPDDAERARLAVDLFGTGMEELGMQNIERFLADLASSNDYLNQGAAAFEGAGDAALNSLERDGRALINTLNLLIVDGIMPLLEAMRPIVKEVTGWLVENREEIAKVMPWIILGAGAFATLGAVGLGGGILALVGGMGSLIGVMGGTGAIVLGAIAIGAAILAIGFWIVKMITDTEATWAWTKRTISDIGKFIWGILDTSALGKEVQQLVMDTTMGLFNAAQGISDFIADWMNGGSGLVNTAVSWMEKAVEGLWRMLDGMGGMGQKIKGIFKGVLADVIPMVNSIIRMGNMLAGIWNTVVVPKTGASKINYMKEMEVPQMATGGDVLGPTLLMAGEKDPETIVNRGLMNEHLAALQPVLQGAARSGGEGQQFVFTGDIIIKEAHQNPRELAAAIREQMAWEANRRIR